MTDQHFQVKVQDGVPVTAGHLTYAVARTVADDMCGSRKLHAEVVDENTGDVVYSIEPFPENVIPLRPGIRPQGVEHGPERE